MANDLVITDPSAIPAWLQDFPVDEPNLTPRETVPSLTYAGKMWTVSVKGEKTSLTRVNEDGDEEPLPIMRVVILNFNANRGRNYYKQGYDPEKVMKPDCFSNDAKRADASIVEPPFEGWTGKCENCPMSIKGSKVTDAGKDVTACQLHRMVAVIPISKKAIFHTALRMRLAITSLYDKDNPEEKNGWYAFDNFIGYLRKAMPNGHTAQMVTKMKFDPAVNYPKVLFAQDRWVSKEEKEALIPIVNSDEVKDLISAKWSSNGVDGTRTDAPTAQGHEGSGEAAQPKPAIKPDPKPVAEAVVVRQKAADVAKAVAKGMAPEKAAEPFVAPPAADDDEEDEGAMGALTGEVIPPKPVAATKGNGAAKANGKAGKAPPVVTKVPPEGLSDLLTDWDT